MSTQEKYLQAIYEITEEGEESAKTSQIADKIQVSDASVTEAVQKLEEQDLVCRAPYKGFTLSPMGIKRAQKLQEKQKTVTKYLKHELDLDNAEKQAKKITSDLEQETIQKMKQKTK